jgi:hypothetical protein
MPRKDNRSTTGKPAGSEGQARQTQRNDSYTPDWQRQRYEGFWLQRPGVSTVRPSQSLPRTELVYIHRRASEREGEQDYLKIPLIGEEMVEL